MLDQLIRAALKECAGRRKLPLSQAEQLITAWIKQNGETFEHK